MRVNVTSEEVETKSGTSKKTGKPYTVHEQKATAENSRFRMPVRLTLGDDGKPYPIGAYDVDFEASVKIGQYGDFGWERQLVLVPVKSAKAA